MSVTIGVSIVRADGVDLDAAWRVLQRGAFGEAEDAVLGGVVGGAAGQANEAPERGAVHDRPAALIAHLAQLVLHAVPDAAEVDRRDTLEALGRLVGRVGGRDHDAGVVECHVEPPELGDGALHEGGDLALVGDVAGDTEGLASRGGQLVGRGAERAFVYVGEHDRRAGGREGPGGVEPHATAGPGDERDLATEVVGWIHGCSNTLIASRWSIAR
jgi:hypothetical protein